MAILLVRKIRNFECGTHRLLIQSTVAVTLNQLQTKKDLCLLGWQMTQLGLFIVIFRALSTLIWVAGIFWKQRSFTEPYKYMVAASIIGPTTVISVWGGAFALLKDDNVKYKIPPPKLLVVGSGLSTTELKIGDTNTQIREVEYILPYSDEDPNNKEFHLVIIRLKSPLNFTGPYVRAICWPTDNLPHLKNGLHDQAFYIATGFSSVSRHQNGQKALSQPIGMIKKEDCANSFRYYYKGETGDHILCGRSSHNVTRTDLTPASCVSHGSSLVFTHQGKYYLGGLVALIPSKSRRGNRCMSNTLYFFTNFLQVGFSPFNQWLQRQLVCKQDEFSCPYQDCIPLSKVCNKVRDCIFSLLGDGDEEEVYCEATNNCKGNKNYSCGLNDNCIEMSQLCDQKIDCRNSNDESEVTCASIIPSPSNENTPSELSTPRSSNTDSEPDAFFRLQTRGSYVQCKMLQYSQGVHQVCMNENQIVSCDDAVPGTKMTLSCKPYFESKFRSTLMTMTCGVNGRWTPFRPFSCEAICGSIMIEDTPGFIVHGQETMETIAFPWYAAIFVFNDNSNKYDFICGSSIIETSLLVTAAHCVSDGNPRSTKYKNLRIVLAPVSSDFEENVMNNSTTIVGVDGIWIPPTFNHLTLTSDIALLRLDRSVEYNAKIRPLCYLSKIKGASSVPKIGTVGKVAGFGKDETGMVSRRLKWTSFPVYSREFCSDILKTQIADNEFCSGYQNASVCMGDSGGSLVFPYESHSRTIYVLKGIVSRGKLTLDGECDVNSLSIFSHFDSFNDWIYDVIEQIGVP